MQKKRTVSTRARCKTESKQRMSDIARSTKFGGLISADNKILNVEVSGELDTETLSLFKMTTRVGSPKGRGPQGGSKTGGDAPARVSNLRTVQSPWWSGWWHRKKLEVPLDSAMLCTSQKHLRDYFLEEDQRANRDRLRFSVLGMP